MLKNYLTIAYRNLVRHAGYSFLSIASLAIGLAACMLIALYVQDELSYDRFHEKADRLYFVGVEAEVSGDVRVVGSPPALAHVLRTQFPEVELVTQSTTPARRHVRGEGGAFLGESILRHVDPNFLELFSFPLLRGDPRTALEEPFTAVLTERAVSQYFGDDDPIGRIIQMTPSGAIDRAPYRITGIVADPPKNSSIDFDVLLSATSRRGYPEPNNWFVGAYETYVTLTARRSPDALVETLTAVASENVAQVFPHYQPFLMPLTDLYLSDVGPEGMLKGDWRYIYLFSAVALVILLIAAINYVNLATARAGRRAMEVGVRKTVGANRRQLVQQFLAESTLLSLVAFVLALVLAVLCLPLVNDVFEKSIEASIAGHDRLLGVLFGLAIVIGLVSGSYPAFFLSAFDPVPIVMRYARRGRSGIRFRQGLIVLQFALSIVLIAGTFIVFRQLNYVQQKELGYQTDGLVVVSLLGQDLGWQAEALREAFLAHPNVLRASANSSVPGRGFSLRASVSDPADAERQWPVLLANVDFDYLETLGMRLIEGRNFSPDLPSDATDAVLLNETAIRQLGGTDAVGRALSGFPHEPTVIGVVEDFHTHSLHGTIAPVVLRMRDPQEPPWPPYDVIALRLGPGDVAATLGFIRETYERFAPGEPYTYYFLDDEFNALHRTDHQLGKAVTAGAAIAILIACLGLFGLAAFAAEQRTKEVAIRKVSGATERDVVALLSRDFALLVGIAFFLAAAPAYLVVQWWLERFAYRVDAGADVVLAAGAVACVIAIVTVGGQALRAARTNPAEALRQEC